MTIEERNKALEIISNRQNDDNGRGCNQVSVKIGTTWKDGGTVDHTALILIDAPAAILNALKDNGYSLSVHQYAGGVSVSKY